MSQPVPESRPDTSAILRRFYAIVYDETGTPVCKVDVHDLSSQIRYPTFGNMRSGARPGLMLEPDARLRRHKVVTVAMTGEMT